MFFLCSSNDAKWIWTQKEDLNDQHLKQNIRRHIEDLISTIVHDTIKMKKRRKIGCSIASDKSDDTPNTRSIVPRKGY